MMDSWPLTGMVGLLVGVVVEICTRRRWHAPTVADTRREDVRLAPRPPRFSPWWACAMAGAWILTALTDAPPVADSIVGLFVRATVVTFLAAAARTDLAERRLPDALTLPAAILCLAAAPAALCGDPDAARALLAAVAVPTVLFAVTLMAGGIGLGDVKAGASVGALLALHGWGVLMTGLVLAWAGAAAIGLVLLARGARRDTPIPLGPFLLLGTLTAPFLA